MGAFRTSRDVRLEAGMRVKADVRDGSGFMGSRPSCLLAGLGIGVFLGGLFGLKVRK
jgi:hypothetical protein